MKLKNISFISLALLSGVFATNCTDDIENFSNKIFMTDSDPSTVLIKPTSVEESHEFTLSIPKPEGQDVTFTIAADASLVSAYETYITQVEWKCCRLIIMNYQQQQVLYQQEA